MDMVEVGSVYSIDFIADLPLTTTISPDLLTLTD